MKSSLKIFLLLINLNIYSSDLKRAQEYKTHGYKDLGRFSQQYAITEGLGKSWYPYLRTAIKNLLEAAELYSKNLQDKEVEKILYTIDQNIGELEKADQEEARSKIRELKKPKIN